MHTGEQKGHEGSNVVGFARFRLGRADPTPLVELVRQPQTRDTAIAAAKAAFEAAGLKVAVCGDFPGRIIDRLVRPYLNAALRRLDEKLASAEDMDKTLCLGLGYPEGPISLLERTGLAEHHDVTQALYQALGQEPYAPARRAQVAQGARTAASLNMFRTRRSMDQATLPTPVANADSQPYWDAARERRLVIRKCKACGELHFMPRHLCPACWSDQLEWVGCQGHRQRAQLHHHPPRLRPGVRAARALCGRADRPRRGPAHDGQHRGRGRARGDDRRPRRR